MKKGLLIVFSGLSGVGKGTILKELMPMEDLNLAYSVSMTTRAPREGEV
ncbi:MAG: guanylate kinase, partial [Erysipelotrichaceae bacterium]|nr:guanylate kinase [Erysipelotrichaceae bacterium]